MNNKKSREQSFGCSIRSLLLLTSICAALFAIFGTAVRARKAGVDWDLETRDEVVFGATVLLPLCGLLIGHVRFHRVRYIFLGGLFGFLAGILLFAILLIPATAAPVLIVITAVSTVGLLGYGLYVRRVK